MESSPTESAEEYCRQIEAYLCRKNDGHLIRIVGPAFEQVCGWAMKGVPLKVAYRGIDRYFERYYAKGPRRRPVRAEFCEADILDVFDEWRRAVGVPLNAAASDTPDDDSSARQGSLPAHLERVVARLTALRAGEDRSLDSLLDGMVRELDTARTPARAVRGDARRMLVERLRALDASLLDAVRDHCDEGTLRALAVEAEAELAPFRARMAPDAYQQSLRAATDRLLRERRRLPIITFE